MRKIKYTCKNCGWSTSIREEWEDLKPKRCMNKKCNCSFRLNKDQLEVSRPEPVAEIAAPQKEVKQNAKPQNKPRKEISQAE